MKYTKFNPYYQIPQAVGLLLRRYHTVWEGQRALASFDRLNFNKDYTS